MKRRSLEKQTGAMRQRSSTTAQGESQYALKCRHGQMYGPIRMLTQNASAKHRR